MLLVKDAVCTPHFLPEHACKGDFMAVQGARRRLSGVHPSARGHRRPEGQGAHATEAGGGLRRGGQAAQGEGGGGA